MVAGVTWPSILPPGWTVEWDPASAEEEHEEWWDRLPHLSVYLPLVLFRCTSNNDDYFCKNSDDDDVINLILLNLWFYVLLYLLCASPSSENVVLDPVSGLVGLDPRDWRVIPKCGLASKAGLRHLSWNNSGSSATAGIRARTTTEESINYEYHSFSK
jgi:hypothetical protein